MKIPSLVLAVTLGIGCGSVNGNDDDGNEVDAGVAAIDAPLEDLDGAIAVREAPQDGDSLAAPAESHFLSITGERNFVYAEEISAPLGDGEDFVEFEFPNNSNPAQVVRITLDCSLTGQAAALAAAAIFEDGLITTSQVACNAGQQTLTVNNTKVQTAHVKFTSVSEASHIDYTLTVVGFQ